MFKRKADAPKIHFMQTFRTDRFSRPATRIQARITNLKRDWVMSELQTIFTVKEAAQFLRIGRGTIYTLIGKRLLQPFKLGKRTLIRREELERLISAAQRAA